MNEENQQSQQTNQQGTSNGQSSTASEMFSPQGSGGGNEQQTSTPAPAPQTPAAPATASFTPEALAEAFTKAQQKLNPQQQQAPMTEAEFKKLFNVFEADDELVTNLFGQIEDENVRTGRRGALNNMGKNVVKNALTVAAALIEKKHAEMTERFAPVMKYYEEQQMERMEQQFFTKHADLQNYKPLVVMVKDQLKASGARFETVEQAFEEVARLAKETIKSLPGGGVQNGTQGAVQPQQQQSASTMSRVATGGQGGAGGGGGNGGGQKTTAAKLFGR